MKPLIIGIKGAGEMATAVACILHTTVSKSIFMMETPVPMAVRRTVAFSEAVYDGSQTVENIRALRTHSFDEIQDAWKDGSIAVAVDPGWSLIQALKPQVVIDAVIAKKNLGTTLKDAPLTIGLGPGFKAPEDVHVVIETNRGHHLGRIIENGEPEPNTGIPGPISGCTYERILRAPCQGIFQTSKIIGDSIRKDDIVATVNNIPVNAGIDGIIRGLIRSGIPVAKGMKLGDIDPRGDISYCHTLSDKARAIGGAVLQTILKHIDLSGSIHSAAICSERSEHHAVATVRLS